MLYFLYRRTEYKQVTIHLQFADGYPREPVIVELKSKTLSDKLLDGLLKVCDDEAKKHVGQRQVTVELCFHIYFNNKEMFYLTTHSTHFIYVGHMVKDHSDSERGIPLPPHGLLFLINSKGSFICTISQTRNSSRSRGALAGTRNSSMGPPHEGLIRRPITP